MYKIDDSTAVAVMPTPGAIGVKPNSYFGAGTKVTADWLNAVQEELCNVITGAGLSLDKTAQDQLLAAINALIASAPVTLTTDLDTNGHNITATGDLNLEPGSGIVSTNGSLACTSFKSLDGTCETIASGGNLLFKIGGTTVLTLSSAGLKLFGTTTVNSISDDLTLAGNSSTTIPTQAAVKGYADATIKVNLPQFYGFSDTSIAAGSTMYLSVGAAASSINPAYAIRMPFAGTITGFVVRTAQYPSLAETFTYTLMNGYSPTSFTCTQSATENFTGGSASVAVAEGDYISLKIVTSASAQDPVKVMFTFYLEL